MKPTSASSRPACSLFFAAGLLAFFAAGLLAFFAAGLLAFFAAGLLAFFAAGLLAFFAAGLLAFFAVVLFAAGSTSFLAPETTPLNSAPGRNFGSFVALIFTASPVRGLRPIRALRAVDSNTPKPATATLSPFATAFFVSSRNASTMSVTSFLLWPRRSATLSIKSALFTSGTPPKGAGM